MDSKQKELEKLKKDLMPYLLKQVWKEDKKKPNIHIEGTLRHQDNLLLAKKRYGLNFEGEIIYMTAFDYFDDYFSDGLDENLIPVLVCKNDHSLILGKPRYYPIDFQYCKIELVKMPHELYYTNIIKYNQ